MTQRVGIIGHGLTGIAAAVMLARGGYQVTLIGPKPSFAGGLQLAPNGLAALRALGMAEAVMEKAVQLDTILITAMGDGRRLAEIPHHDKRIYVGMGRDDLYALFQAEAIQQKNLHLVPSPAVSIARAENAAEVVLEDGQLLYFDEILGADGANGLCRSFVCGARLNRKTAPYYAMRAELPADQLPRLFSRPQTQLILGDGCHFVSYPIAGMTKINVVFCASAETLAREWQIEILQSHLLLKYVQRAAPAWAKLPLYTDSPLASWRRLQVTLIGDAAHVMPPHLAQGAGQSFEDIADLQSRLTEEGLSHALRSMAVSRAGALKSISGKAGLTGQMMRLSGLPGQLRDSLLGLTGTQLVENWLADVWQAHEKQAGR